MFLCFRFGIQDTGTDLRRNAKFASRTAVARGTRRS